MFIYQCATTWALCDVLLGSIHAIQILSTTPNACRYLSLRPLSVSALPWRCGRLFVACTLLSEAWTLNDFSMGYLRWGERPRGQGIMALIWSSRWKLPMFPNARKTIEKEKTTRMKRLKIVACTCTAWDGCTSQRLIPLTVAPRGSNLSHCLPVGSIPIFVGRRQKPYERDEGRSLQWTALEITSEPCLSGWSLS